MNYLEIGKFNKSDPSTDTFPKINLEEILLNVAQSIIDDYDFHWVEYYCLEQNTNQARLIANFARVHWEENDGEHYVVSDYPSTKEVLTTGKPIILNHNMDDPETDWMTELGYAHGLLLPLYQNDKIIGLAEVATPEKFAKIDQKEIRKCKRIIQESSKWLTSPNNQISKEKLFSLASQLKDVTRCTACSFSEWDADEDIGKVFLDHSNSFFGYGNGPIISLDDWHLAKNVLVNLKPSIIFSNSPKRGRNSSLYLDQYNIKTEVILPLTIDNQPFGFIVIFDVLKERSINNEELYSLGHSAGQIALAIQNAQMLDFAQRKLLEQKARQEATEIILSSLEINTVLSLLAKQFCKAVNITSAYINILNSNLSGSTVIAEFITSEAAPEEKESDIGETYNLFDDELFVQKMAKNLYDISQVNGLEIQESEITHMKKYGAKSILYIPLLVRNKIIGFTELWESRFIRDFTPDEISLCKDISNQAAIAIENAQLYQKTLDEIKQKEITQLKLMKSEQYYRNLFENAHDAIIIFNLLNDHILDVNPHACDLFGYHKDKFRNLKLTAILNDCSKYKKQLSITLGNGKNSNMEAVGINKDGSIIHLEVNSSLVEYEGNEAILGVFRNVTYRKTFEERLIHDAMHDDLTGLPNRTQFLSNLDKALARKKRDEEFNFAVFFFDLDNFKNINDSLGHSVGDKYLKALAVLLEQESRKVDTLARFGGDEFAILIESFRDIVEVNSICIRIFNVLNSEIIIDQKPINSSASIGIVLGKSSYSKPGEIIRDADIAMYKAKEIVGNSFEIFDKKLRTQLYQELNLEQELEKALENHEFTLFYQPIVSLSDDSIYGLEALIRWQKPGKGLVYPNEFLPFAEKSGVIKQIDEMGIRIGIEQILKWDSQISNFSNLTVSFNISNAQLEYQHFSEELLAHLKESELDTSRVSLEITESVFIQNIENALKHLDFLNNQGLKLFLDDFGSGFSSLRYLVQLPIQILKIDQTFVKNATQTNNLNLLRSVINLGQDLGLKIIAEGIETKEQFNSLRRMGCDFGQGYFIQKPVDADSTTRFLHNQMSYAQND